MLIFTPVIVPSDLQLVESSWINGSYLLIFDILICVKLCQCGTVYSENFTVLYLYFTDMNFVDIFAIPISGFFLPRNFVYKFHVKLLQITGDLLFYHMTRTWKCRIYTMHSIRIVVIYFFMLTMYSFTHKRIPQFVLVVYK